jgi:hypothetical protein
MSEITSIKIAVGDDVRVHFHPPFPEKSFIEGTVIRVDETFPDGPLIVVDVSHQVILGRQTPIRRGHQEYILSERWKDFPDQIEVMPMVADPWREALPDPIDQGIPEDPIDQRVLRETSHDPMNEPMAYSEQTRSAQQHKVPQRGSFIAALFGRAR